MLKIIQADGEAEHDDRLHDLGPASLLSAHDERLKLAVLVGPILLLLHDKHPYWRTCQGSQVATTRARSTIKRRFSVRNVFPIEFSVNHMPQQHFTTPLRVEISHPLITGFQQMPTNRMIRDTKERNLFVLRIFTLKKPYDIVSRMSNQQNRRIPIVGIRSHVLHQISVITSVTNPCVDIIVFCTPHM